MPKAWIITHPETKMDAQGRIHGHLDPPLSEKGRYRAKQIARGLKNKNISKIHSSPRQRALETANMIGKETGAPVEIHSDLLPWDLASMSGAKTASIRPLLDFFCSRPNKVVPGGESKAAVLARYSKFIKTVKPGEAVVGHSQHIQAYDYVKNGGDAAKVPMVGGKSGEVKEVTL